MQLSSLRCSFSGPDPLKRDRMFIHHNDVSFDSSFVFLFNFSNYFFSLRWSVFNRVCHQFQTVSQIYRSKEARIRKRCRKIYTTHDGELIIFLSHIHPFPPLSLSLSLSLILKYNTYILFSYSSSHLLVAI